MTMVERLARALWEDWSRCQICPEWQREITWEWLAEKAAEGAHPAPLYYESALSQARAAIEALREPNEAMLAGLYDDPIWEYKDSYLGKQQVIDMWKHMIDAALSESTPTPAGGA